MGIPSACGWGGPAMRFVKSLATDSAVNCGLTTGSAKADGVAVHRRPGDQVNLFKGKSEHLALVWPGIIWCSRRAQKPLIQMCRLSFKQERQKPALLSQVAPRLRLFKA
jgi:hypothetical protein